MQIAQIAGQQQSHDGPVAIGQHLVAADDTVQHQMHEVRGVALLDDVLAMRHLVRALREAIQKVQVHCREPDHLPQLARQEIVDRSSPLLRGPLGLP